MANRIAVIAILENRTRPLVWCIPFFIVLAGTVSLASAQSTVSVSVGRLDAGVRVGDETLAKWNRVVILAKPRLASGDTDSVPAFVRESVSKFVLTILATVEPLPEGRYQLAEVGIGHCVQVNQSFVVIRPNDAKSHGIDLSFLQRQILTENQRHFDDIRTIARTSTLLMFDVPALLNRDGRHEDFVMRHLIWVNSRTGSLATLIWPLQTSKSSSIAVVDAEPPRWWNSNLVEDRAIHVDAKEFTLGIPGKRAFALERTPPGQTIAWTNELRELAALERYDEQSLKALLLKVNEAGRLRNEE